MNQKIAGRAFCLSLVLLALFGPRGEGRAATFVVTTASDGVPSVPAGSLRAAILSANANAGLDVISFQIPGTGVHTINLVATLPAISEAVVIDGTTQPGYVSLPLIELNGSAAGSTPGLRLIGGNAAIRGLVLNRFIGGGIDIEGPPGTNVIQGNFIGVDPTGSVRSPNLLEGILIKSSSGNTVGGLDAANRNVICASGDNGVYLLNGGSNVVQGNFIGINALGTSSLGNTNNGIAIYNSKGNLIGGTAAGAQNIISGNAASGIYLTAGSSGNQVQGNYLGTDLTGALAINNRADGITLQGAANNVIGGTDAGARNVISANGGAGVAMLGVGTTNNLLQGNFIGTDASGHIDLGNALSGVTILGASNNVVGGTISAGLNVISGNQQDGVTITTNSSGNVVQGNYIGVDVTGSASLGNGFNGIRLASCFFNTVGGTAPGAGNVLSGNGFYGAHLLNSATGNLLQGNYIGSDALGRNSVANQHSGVRVESGGNLIGGVNSGAGNLISGNLEDGIFIVGTGASSNLVQGNLIGTQVSGTLALGNGRAGIGISAAPANTIGGIIAGAGNVISANNSWGIYIIDPTATGNQIQGNTIGADITGTVGLGTSADGIQLYNASTNFIGGAVPGAGNLISANLDGIYAYNSSWNVVQGNLAWNWMAHRASISSAATPPRLEIGLRSALTPIRASVSV